MNSMLGITAAALAMLGATHTGSGQVGQLEAQKQRVSRHRRAGSYLRRTCNDIRFARGRIKAEQWAHPINAAA